MKERKYLCCLEAQKDLISDLCFGKCGRAYFSWLSDGELNYVITKIMKEVYPLRYYHINKAIGVLECIKQEFYRRVAAPYEDQKMKENGDV